MIVSDARGVPIFEFEVFMQEILSKYREIKDHVEGDVRNLFFAADVIFSLNFF